MSTIKDVAARAGVSISTVSRVLNDSKNVSEELRNKVEDAVKELDFTFNDMARGLKNSQTKKIAVIIPRISRSFFSDVLDGIHMEAEKRGYSMLITESYDDLEKETQLIDSLVSQWVDGIILASSISSLEGAAAKSYIRKLQQLQKKDSKIPVVTLEFALSSGIDAVVFDNCQAAYDAVSYLIQQTGRSKIMFMGLPEKSYLGKERLEGYQQALYDHELEWKESRILSGAYTTYSGYTAMKEAISKGLDGDGIFCSNDQMAIGVIKACEEAGIRIPQDLAVIGVDDIYAASIVTPSLSSICFPKQEMGMAAMGRMAEILEGHGTKMQISEHRTLQYEIIERQTTNPEAKTSLKFSE